MLFTAGTAKFFGSDHAKLLINFSINIAKHKEWKASKLFEVLKLKEKNYNIKNKVKKI